jgi:DNA-binding transcriptional MerR regulator
LSSYSIKDLEELTGIKAHTIRAWEKRYKIIQPKRTPTNIRYYTDEDLKLLLNIALLYNNGYKISKLSSLSTKAIQQQALSLTKDNYHPNVQIEGLISATVDMDNIQIDRLLSRNIIQYGLETTMMTIVFPFLHRLGILWQTGAISPVQEHMFSHILRQKIIVAIDGFKSVTTDHINTYLLFLPQWEQHEISLLFTSYILQSRNKKVVFLGCNTPLEDLSIAYNIHNPYYLFTVFSNGIAKKELENYIQTIYDQFNNSQLIISGKQITNFDKPLNIPSSIQIVHSIQELINNLDTPDADKSEKVAT